MKKRTAFLKSFLALGFLFLSACDEVEFENGRVPNEYLPQAKALVGTYSGQFSREKSTLKLDLYENLAVLSFQSASGNDLLGPDCHSQIGILKRARIKDQRISNLYFKFKPGQCDIPGRELDLQFSNNYKKITLRLRDHDKIVQECEWNDRGRVPPVPPVYECHNVVYKQYLTGTFVR